MRCCYGFFTGKKRFDLSCIAGKRKDSRTGQPVCEWYFAAGQFHERPSAYTDEGFQSEKTDGGAKPVFLPGILGKYQIIFIIRSCFGLFQRRTGCSGYDSSGKQVFAPGSEIRKFWKCTAPMQFYGECNACRVL